MQGADLCRNLLQFELVESFFLQTTENLKALSDCLQARKISASRAVLNRLHMAAMQIGFFKLASEVHELLRCIEDHPGKLGVAKSQFFFVKCELHMLQTRWYTLIRSKDPLSELDCCPVPWGEQEQSLVEELTGKLRNQETVSMFL
jgi:hypothetical protein